MKRRSNRIPTAEFAELDVGLSALGEEIGDRRVQVNGLGEKVKGQLEVVIDECFPRSPCKFARH